MSPDATPSAALLEVRSVAKRFGGLEVLQNVSLTVRRGQIHSLIGPNGAGKSTLFSIIAGAARSDQGEIRLNGESVTRQSSAMLCKLGLARTFQTPRPFGRLTVRQNVRIGATFGAGGHVDPSTVEERAANALVATGLESAAETLAAELSLGHLKRLELARVAATGAQILLLDEVMGGLNEGEVDRICATLLTLQERGVTLLLVDHVMKPIMTLSDEVSVLAQGRIVMTDVPSAVATDPEVIRLYLGGAAHAA